MEARPRNAIKYSAKKCVGLLILRPHSPLYDSATFRRRQSRKKGFVPKLKFFLAFKVNKSGATLLVHQTMPRKQFIRGFYCLLSHKHRSDIKKAKNAIFLLEYTHTEISFHDITNRIICPLSLFCHNATQYYVFCILSGLTHHKVFWVFHASTERMR